MCVMELIPNQDDCSQFEPNLYKKERCINCSRPWNEHLGVISPEELKNILDERDKLQQDKQKAHDMLRQKSLTNNFPPTKDRAVEDNWFFDGTLDENCVDYNLADSDDDADFRMITPPRVADLTNDRPPLEFEPIKVVNFIDFDECDRLELTLDSSGADNVSDVAPSIGVSQENLVSEIQHLRQRLADANEEKKIEAAIFKDEVIEKQALIDKLSGRLLDVEGKSNGPKILINPATGTSVDRRTLTASALAYEKALLNARQTGEKAANTLKELRKNAELQLRKLK